MKPIVLVFLIIATLVVIFLLWSIFFQDGGLLASAWNGIATAINDTWKTLTGADADDIVPLWGTNNDANTLDGAQGLIN